MDPIFLPFLQSCQRSILPQNRRHIRNRSQKTFMAAAQCTVAKSSKRSSRISQNLSLITFRRTSNIHQVNRHYALIKSSVELMASICISLNLLLSRKEHDSIHGCFTSLLQFFHNLYANIIVQYAVSLLYTLR